MTANWPLIRTMPDHLRMVADEIATTARDDEVGIVQALMLATSTLRMAAVAWPPECRPLARAHVTNLVRGVGFDAYEEGRRLGFEQGMQKCQEYTAAAEQDEREAAKRRGEPVPGTRETVEVARVAAVVANHWRQQREHPQPQWEPVGPALASLLDALLAQVDAALEQTKG